MGMDEFTKIVVGLLTVALIALLVTRKPRKLEAGTGETTTLDALDTMVGASPMVSAHPAVPAGWGADTWILPPPLAGMTLPVMGANPATVGGFGGGCKTC